MGHERAETYLRLMAEAELRRAGDQLRGPAAAAGTDWSDPGMAPSATAESAHWKVGQAGRILVAAGGLDQDYLDRIAADLHVPVKTRPARLFPVPRREARRLDLVGDRTSLVRLPLWPPDACGRAARRRRSAAILSGERLLVLGAERIHPHQHVTSPVQAQRGHSPTVICFRHRGPIPWWKQMLRYFQ